MAEREPTVIERMAKAYLHDRNIGMGDLGAASQAMLAAVRELQQCFCEIGKNGGSLGRACDDVVIALKTMVINDHLARAGRPTPSSSTRR